MEKKFDTVEMMRRIRDKLSETYSKYPEKEEEELKEIRKKYGIKEKVKDA
ncbi:MAG: hypothetical protein ACP5RW_05735 [bacterium]